VEFKIARDELSSKPKKIKLSQIESDVADGVQKIFYFDKENSHKDMMALVEHFENSERGIYFKEVKYGLDDSDYIYEVHIV